MQVILLEKVENLGNLGDEVNVAPGYARNFLLPTEKALKATPGNKKRFEAQRKAFEERQAELLAEAKGIGEKMEGLTVQLDRRVAEAGRLFGSVANADVADAINEQGFEIERGQVLMPEGPIKEIGEHTVNVRLHPDVLVDVTVSVSGI